MQLHRSGDCTTIVASFSTSFVQEGAAAAWVGISREACIGAPSEAYCHSVSSSSILHTIEGAPCQGQVMVREQLLFLLGAELFTVDQLFLLL